MSNTVDWDRGQESTHNSGFCVFPASVNLELPYNSVFSHNQCLFSHINVIDFLKETLENCSVLSVCFPVFSLITE